MSVNHVMQLSKLGSTFSSIYQLLQRSKVFPALFSDEGDVWPDRASAHTQ